MNDIITNKVIESVVPEFKPIVISLADDDLYKFTMQQTILHSNPAAKAEYTFHCRNNPDIPLSTLLDEVNRQLDHLCTLRFTQDELDFFRTLRYMKSDYVDFLEGFQLRRRFITAKVSDTDPNVLDITVDKETPMLQGMMFEIHTLAIVNETYFRQFETPEVIAEGQRRLAAKVQQLNGYFDLPDNRLSNAFEFVEFGTRRRFSRVWQEQVVKALAKSVPEYFKGTSNVDLARRYKLTPVGTMAHEYLQAFQGFDGRLLDFQKAAFEAWVQEYRGDLGIALTDVVGMDAFLEDFDLYFAKLFDGLRHDSGDPVIWGYKALNHYKKLHIHPSTKSLSFSNGLDMTESLRLYKEFASTIKVKACIGTSLTNDLGPTPLNIVMKMTMCNGQPTAKISDSAGKGMCKDAGFITYLKQVFNIKEEGI